MSAIDPFGSEYRSDPVAVFARLRADEPVIHVTALDAHLVTRQDLVTVVLDDPETYSNERPPDGLGAAPDPAVRTRLAEVRSQGWPHVPAIADQDDPHHHAFRTIVAPFFTPSRLRPLADDLASICDRLIDDVADRPTVDFIEAFAGPLPLHVVALVLRLGESGGAEQLARFARWRDSQWRRSAHRSRSRSSCAPRPTSSRCSTTRPTASPGPPTPMTMSSVHSGGLGSPTPTVASARSSSPNR